MIWVLTIRGEAEWRICSSPERQLFTDGSTGKTYTFWPGLDEPEDPDTADATMGKEVPIRVPLPADGWESLSGSDPCGWTAELAFVAPGADWRDREVRVDGRVDRPVYETVSDPVDFSIIENVWDDRSLFPPPGQQVGAATWPVNGSASLPENVDGMWYPWVFGCPGYVYPSDSFAQMFGWPAILVEIDPSTRNNFDSGAIDATVLIAGHVCGFSEVVIYNRTTGSSATIAMSTTKDLLGSIVTVATVAGGDLEISDGDELWASAAGITKSGVSTSDSRPLRQVGQLVRWLLEHSTVRIDQTMTALLARLDRFKADFYVNEQTSAWAIIQDKILADNVIPAFWRRSRWGYFLAVQPFDTTTPIMQITEALGWTRDGGLTCSSGQDVITDATILYAQDEAQGAPLRSLTYGPVAANGATANPYLSSAYAALNQRPGNPIRKRLALETGGIQDPATARLCLDLAVRRLSTTTRTGAYICQNPDTGAEVGMVVSVTMPNQNLSRRLCWITSVERSMTETRIEVETLPDLQRTGPI